MSAKTYKPGAELLAKTAHRYLTRYQPQLEANMSTAERACLVTLITALAEFILCVLTPAPNP